MLKRILTGVVLAVMLTGGGVAGPLEEAVVAYQRGDYATALRLWRPLAEQGDAGAQYNLGVMCVRGMGVQQDYVEAHMWFTLAASRYANSENRERAVQNVDRAASHMAPTQIAEAQKLAQEWKPK